MSGEPRVEPRAVDHVKILRCLVCGSGIGLVLFQMFIVGAFRTYRYDLYKDEHTRNRESPALTIFRKPTGGPWTIYCCTAAVGAIPWVFALARVITGSSLVDFMGYLARRPCN